MTGLIGATQRATASFPAAVLLPRPSPHRELTAADVFAGGEVVKG